MTYLKTVPLSMRVIWTAGIAIALTWSFAGQAVAEDSKGPVDKKAMTILQGMSDYLSKEPTLSFRAWTFFDVVQKSWPVPSSWSRNGQAIFTLKR